MKFILDITGSIIVEADSAEEATQKLARLLQEKAPFVSVYPYLKPHMAGEASPEVIARLGELGGL